MSVIVEDGHQRRGIGSLLVNELATLASNAGVAHLRAVAPAGGDGLARTLRHAGLDVTVRRDGEALVFDCVRPPRPVGQRLTHRSVRPQPPYRP